MNPSERQIKDWERRLWLIHGEIETAYGDPPLGGHPAKLECLVFYAWQEAHAMLDARAKARL